MNEKASLETTFCLTEEAIGKILAGDGMVGDQEVQANQHLETCRACRGILDQQLSEVLAGMPHRPPELKVGDDERVAALVRILIESERVGQLQLHDKAIQDHLDQGNGPYLFGDFELIGHLASGGMGSVYEARDLKLGRRCALKLINSGMYATNDEIQRFLREANAAASLDHPSIVRVYSAGLHRDTTGLDRHYVAMEMVHGESLEKKIQSGKKISERQIAMWVKQIAEALTHAHGDDLSQPKFVEREPVMQGGDKTHRHRIVHRDIKPSNVLINFEGIAKIIDFGLAKFANADQVLTRHGAIIGTLAYMSPEQASGGLAGVGSTSDIFSLGAVLYELLTGQRPFPGRSQIETFNLICKHEPTAPRKLNRTISLDLETICLKCLEKEPHRRYPRAQDLADDLNRFLGGHPITARRIGRIGRAWKWCRRNPGYAAVSALVILLLIGIGGLGIATYSAKIRNDASKKLLAATTDLHEQEDYFYKVRSANFEWSNNRLDSMEQILQSCPVNRRDMEWYLLNSFCHQELFSIQKKAEELGDVFWTPDGQSILVLGNRSTEFWNVDEKRMVKSIPIVGDGTCDVCWRKNLIAIGRSRGPSIDLVALDDGKLVRSQSMINFDVISEVYLAIDPQGRWLVGAMHDKVCVWDLDSGAVLSSWNLEDQTIRSVKFHPFEPWLVTLTLHVTNDLSFPIATIWEIPSGRKLHDLFGTDTDKWPITSDFSPDGKLLVTGTMRDPRAAGEEEIAIWDIASGQNLGLIRGHNGGIVSVAFHPNRREIMTAGLDSLVCVREYSERGQFLSEKTRKYLGRGKFSVATISPNGTRFATADEGIVRIWDYFKSQVPLLVDGHPKSGVFSTAISPDGKTIASGGARGIVKLADIETGRELREFSGLESDGNYVAFGLAFSTDVKRLAGVGRGIDKQGVLWDVETGQKIAEFSVSSENAKENYQDLTSVAFHPDGKTIVTGGSGKLIRVWDATDGELINEWSVETSRVTQLAYSADGRLGVVGEPVALGGDFLTAVMEPLTGRLDRIFDSKLAPTRVAFSADPDGRWIAFGDHSRIRVVDSRTGIEKFTLNGHDRAIKSIAFNPMEIDLFPVGMIGR